MRLRVWLLTIVVVLTNVGGDAVLGYATMQASATAGVIESILQPVAILGIVVLTAWMLLRMRLLPSLLQSHGMRQGNGRAWKLPVAVFFMAISFFSFTQLLHIAPLSFTVPASAASIAFGTVLACVVIKRTVEFRRRAGAILVAGGAVLLAQ